MKRITVALLYSLLSIQLPAHAASYEELVLQGDNAVQNKDYQKAENAYIDAFYATHSASAEADFLKKLDQLYKVSGLSPLDSAVKSKLQKFRTRSTQQTIPEASRPQIPIAPPPRIKAQSNVAGTAVPVAGALAQRLVTGCRVALEKLGKTKMQDFQTMENFRGSVLRQSANTYRVECNADFVTSNSRLSLEAVTVLRENGENQFEEISSSVSPRADNQRNTQPFTHGEPPSNLPFATSSASPKPPSVQDFSDWLRSKNDENKQTDNEAMQAASQAQRANERAESVQLKELDDKTKEAEENSNSSNRSSKNH